MESEVILEYIFYNGIQYPKDEKKLNISSNSIYEVVRLKYGIPLFIEDHIRRMRESAHILGYEINRSDSDIVNEVHELSTVNNCNDLNVKLVCSNLDQENQNYITYFIKSDYPKDEYYLYGVDAILYGLERVKPNAKILNEELRQSVKNRNREINAYEGLLVNRDGYITEGSRSNVFFVKDEVVYTAPAEKVLMGVTRKRIIEICDHHNITMVERSIHKNMINDMDGAFITGTSIGVLPLRKVENKTFHSAENEIIKRLAAGYKKATDDYIAQNTR